MTNHEKPIFIKHDVIHYCVPNIPSGFARTASQSISNLTSAQQNPLFGINPGENYSDAIMRRLQPQMAQQQEKMAPGITQRHGCFRHCIAERCSYLV